MKTKPFSQSCEENREPILAVLREVFAACCHVLEIGSGTGQHAVAFGAALPHLTWQTGDLPIAHPGIHLWLAEAALGNVRAPIALDVNAHAWRAGRYDAVFSANTLHIMSWPEVVQCFDGIAEVLLPGGVVAIYGPFNYGGRHTSESNARFDAWLRTRDPDSGIRDFEAVDALARERGLVLQRDVAMPANNRTLVWAKP